MHSLQNVMALINKKYGENTLMPLSKAVGLRIRKFSTGSLMLDIALNGGWALGRINEIAGKYSSYKSTMAVMACKAFLKLYSEGEILWVDVEKTFDPKWAAHLGLDMSRVVIAQPSSGEETVNVCVDTIKDLGSDARVLLILDSVAVIIPQAEKEVDAEKSGGMASQARLMSKFMKRFNSALKRNMSLETPPITALFLNQVRMQPGVMYGDPEMVPGGKVLEHAVSIRVKMNRKEFLYDTTLGEDHKQVYGAKVGFTVLKNKTGGIPNEKGLFTMYNRYHDGVDGGKIDNATDLLPLGVAYGVITRKGHGMSFDTIKGRGKDEFISKLRSDPLTLRVLAREVLKKHHDKMWQTTKPKTQRTKELF